LFFENLDLGNGSLVCKDGMKVPGKAYEFEISNKEDAEIYCIRGYKLN
jgi:hypothetical protein